jgi:hypothetical protein
MTAHSDGAAGDGCAGFERARRAAQEGRPLSLDEVLDIIEGAGQADKVTIGDLQDAFGRRAFGPFLLVPALIAILPVVGALPGVSVGTALADLAVSAALALGHKRVNLPGWARRMAVARKPLRQSIKLIRPVSRWAGKVVKPRLQHVVNGQTRLLTGALAVVLSSLMLVGSLVPGGSVVPALGMILLSLGLTSQDGVLILLSGALGAGSVGLVLWILPL